MSVESDGDNEIEALEIGIEVRDAEAALRFYRDTLGLSPFGVGKMSTPERDVWSLGSARRLIKIIVSKQIWTRSNPRLTVADRAFGVTHFTFKVPDGRQVMAKCAEAGYEIALEWTDLPPDAEGIRPPGGYGYVYDPDGNLVELETGSVWVNSSKPA